MTDPLRLNTLLPDVQRTWNRFKAQTADGPGRSLSGGVKIPREPDDLSRSIDGPAESTDDPGKVQMDCAKVQMDWVRATVTLLLFYHFEEIHQFPEVIIGIQKNEAKVNRLVTLSHDLCRMSEIHVSEYVSRL